MPEEAKARARAAALPVITDYRDRGCPEPSPLSRELTKEVMDWGSARRCPTTTFH
jgi:4-hydroxyacetophenone monooxygenase